MSKIKTMFCVSTQLFSGFIRTPRSLHTLANTPFEVVVHHTVPPVRPRHHLVPPRQKLSDSQKSCQTEQERNQLKKNKAKSISFRPDHSCSIKNRALHSLANKYPCLCNSTLIHVHCHSPITALWCTFFFKVIPIYRNGKFFGLNDFLSGLRK